MKSIKAILKIDKFYSNHALADNLNILLLDHHVMLSQMRYYHQIFNYKNNFLNMAISHLKNGILFTNLSKLFRNRYNCSMIGNDVKALEARIYFVQRNEKG